MTGTALKRTIAIILVLIFASYMVFDDELSKETRHLLEQANPHSNLENNAFIHMSTLGDNSESAYEANKNAYITASEETSSKLLNYNETLLYPIPLIEIDKLPKRFKCSFKHLSCLSEVKENKQLLSKTYKAQINAANNFILNQKNYVYEPLNNLSSTPNYDGFEALNFLIGVSTYFYIIEGKYANAEELLLNHFMFLRKTASSSLDLMPTASFVVSLDRLFLPLIEQLVKAHYKFELPIEEFFYEAPMQELLLRKAISDELQLLHNHFEIENLLNDRNIFNIEYNFSIGFMPNSTLNKVTTLHLDMMWPEGTTKNDYLTIVDKKSGEYQVVEIHNIYWLMLKNPRSGAGDYYVLPPNPQYLQMGAFLAERDLHFLLFNIAIKSQTTAIEELIENDTYIDPYTGNRPYLNNSKVCYPAWPELDSNEGQNEPACIAVAMHND